MNPDTYRAVVAAAMTEDELLEAVRKLAKAYGWLSYHTHNSRRSEPGFPDLVLVRGPRLIFAELKRQSEKPTKDQAAWLAALRYAADETVHVRAYLWRPSDLIAGLIANVLAPTPTIR